MGNRSGNSPTISSGRFSYYTSLLISSGGNHAARQYFQADGSLDTAADSPPVGPITYLRIANTYGGQVNIQIYGPHGVLGTGDGKYTVLLLGAPLSTNPNDSVWEMPEGMVCTGIRVVTDPTSGHVTINAGR